MGLFGPKIVCDQCGKKVKESATVYYRGSRFCNADCVGAFDAANPAPIASGDPGKLRAELAMLIREAIAEANRSFNPTFGMNVGNVQVSIAAPLGAMDQRHAAEQAQTSRQQFQTYVLRAAPLLRALGHAGEARAIDSTDFQKTNGYGLVDVLERIPL